MSEVKFQSLTDTAQIPQRGSLHAAGYDLYAAEDHEIPANTTQNIRLGFATQMPNDIHGRIESRSGMAAKKGLVVLTGVIDADYRGEWHVIMHNLKNYPQKVAAGDKVAQVVFRTTVNVQFTPSDALESSERGGGGFGSTGA